MSTYILHREHRISAAERNNKAVPLFYIFIQTKTLQLTHQGAFMEVTNDA